MVKTRNVPRYDGRLGRDWAFSSVAIISASVLALGNLVAVVLLMRGKLHFGGRWKQSSDAIVPFSLSRLMYPMLEMVFHGLAFS